MTTAHTYKIILAQMDTKIRYNDSWICGLLFAPPNKPISKSLLQCLHNWHQRSADNLDFFCVGYLHHRVFDDDQQLTLLPRHIPNEVTDFHFSTHAFEDITMNIGHLSGWEYTGSPALILVNATQDNGTYRLEGYHLRSRLQFEHMLVLDLERLLGEDTDTGISHLLESVGQACDAVKLSHQDLKAKVSQDKRNWKSLFAMTLGILVKGLRLNVPLRACHFLAGAHYLDNLNGIT